MGSSFDNSWNTSRFSVPGLWPREYVLDDWVELAHSVCANSGTGYTAEHHCSGDCHSCYAQIFPFLSSSNCRRNFSNKSWSESNCSPSSSVGSYLDIRFSVDWCLFHFDLYLHFHYSQLFAGAVFLRVPLYDEYRCSKCHQEKIFRPETKYLISRKKEFRWFWYVWRIFLRG